MFDRNRAAKVRVTEGVQETLDCVREIRATNQEAHYLEGLNRTIDAQEKETTKGELLNGLLVNSAFAVMRLGIATTLIAGAAMVAAGQVHFMVMFAFLLVVSRIYAPFDQALMLVSELFASEASAKRMRSIAEEPIAGGSTEFCPAGHDVVFDHVAFSYGAGPDGRAGEKVLEDVSFTAKEGEVTALVGPSGSGKSTVSRLAARFWDATAGTVAVGDVDVPTVDSETLLRDYAIVFQDVLLFDDTVMGNIRLGRHDATDEEVLAAAKAANCDEFVSRMPEGYNTMIGENGSKLSGGERQRISIARALLKDAPIVLLDEATASLDVENETKVQQALSRLLAGKTVIVIAHRMRTIENADKVVVLADGTVAEQGSPAELLMKGGMFARMVALQKESNSWSVRLLRRLAQRLAGPCWSIATCSSSLDQRVMEDALGVLFSFQGAFVGQIFQIGKRHGEAAYAHAEFKVLERAVRALRRLCNLENGRAAQLPYDGKALCQGLFEFRRHVVVEGVDGCGSLQRLVVRHVHGFETHFLQLGEGPHKALQQMVVFPKLHERRCGIDDVVAAEQHFFLHVAKAKVLRCVPGRFDRPQGSSRRFSGYRLGLGFRYWAWRAA